MMIEKLDIVIHSYIEWFIHLSSLIFLKVCPSKISVRQWQLSIGFIIIIITIIVIIVIIIWYCVLFVYVTLETIIEFFWKAKQVCRKCHPFMFIFIHPIYIWMAYCIPEFIRNNKQKTTNVHFTINEWLIEM